jgi:hypothetical protein
MDETALVLDGNALAGTFAELFAIEVTAARGQCAACGAVDALGAARVYGGPRAPGSVVRCRTCSEVLAVVVRTERAWHLSLAGVRRLDLAAD